ncbi:ABC transporter substrate-binding protein [Leucobacter aridicollis]|uniref:ABC transporter substrate-binding protein n=1 Tax=Leucobacter aridicollis TaxID=283878 RepID=UPI002101FA2A|nr:ABC transporter substrate-binding protein [Leucobacter aridicollis]UTX52238.1 ABC transporter substrate-binding protein [Leucobacter aridicollis]
MFFSSRALRTAITAAMVVTALALTACSTPQSSGGSAATPGVTDDTITIGTHTPLTGPAAPGYASVSAGALAYFAYVNDNGGIHGRNINYIVKDDAYNPANTQMVVRELVQDDQVFAIFNGLGTPPHTSVVDYLNDNGVPDLFVASGSTTWNQPEKYPYTFAFNADYVVEGAALAKYASDEYPGQTVCVYGQDDDLGRDTIEGVELALGADGIADTQLYTTSNADVTAQIGAMRDAGCEINILGAIPGYAALAIGTAARLGWSPQWFVASIGANPSVLRQLLGEETDKDLLEGMVGASFLPAAEGDSDWVTFFREINDEYNPTEPFDRTVLNGMSAAYLFAEALHAAGENPTREAVVNAITSGELRGTGILPLAFSADSHASYMGVEISRVEKGTQQSVGRAYLVEGGSVTAVDPEPAPFVPDGIPGI